MATINNKSNWHFMEAGYIHTSWLSETEADEMVERYSRIFPDIEFCKIYLEQL